MVIVLSVPSVSLSHLIFLKFIFQGERSESYAVVLWAYFWFCALIHESVFRNPSSMGSAYHAVMVIEPGSDTFKASI